VLGAIAADAAAGRLDLGAAVAYAGLALATGTIAFGGLNWALDSAAAPVAAVLRLDSAMDAAGALSPPPEPDHPQPDSPRGGAAGRPAEPGDNGRPEASGAVPAEGCPAREIRFRSLTFGYPSSDAPVLEGFDLTIPAGSSLAIVGRNGSGKTTLAKLLCRLYDPQSGAIEVDGVDLRRLELAGWRDRVTAVFQDFTRFELPLRENVAPGGAPDDVIRAALVDAGAVHLADLDTVLAKGYAGGTDLSGGQWQRIALARALCAVRMGAGVVLLDEPTAQLDVRGESEIFERVLVATRQCTTILISHRFSTVRHADRICVVERGRVVELGSHDELMAREGRYRRMFDLQARPFAVIEGEEEVEHDVLA
jgi:ABC-type multidrug transport system fused ATPase/permease subunit